MSNFDRAVKALNDVDEAIDHLADNDAYVTALEAAGLLAPDLPEPWSEEDEEGALATEWAPNYTVACSDISTGAWAEVERPVGKVWLEPGGAIGMDVSHGEFYMDMEDAKRLALALLAACEYAEKEQGNE